MKNKFIIFFRHQCICLMLKSKKNMNRRVRPHLKSFAYVYPSVAFMKAGMLLINVVCRRRRRRQGHLLSTREKIKHFPRCTRCKNAEGCTLQLHLILPHTVCTLASRNTTAQEVYVLTHSPASCISCLQIKTSSTFSLSFPFRRIQHILERVFPFL